MAKKKSAGDDKGIETGTAALAFLAGLWLLVELASRKSR